MIKYSVSFYANLLDGRELAHELPLRQIRADFERITGTIPLPTLGKWDMILKLVENETDLELN